MLLKTELLVIDFVTPYHVGWRVAEPIIESVTLHRALIYIAAITRAGIVDTLRNVRVSSVLPLLSVTSKTTCNTGGQSSPEHSDVGSYKLLIPLPPVPSTIPLKKFELRYVTLRGFKTLIESAEHGKLFIHDIRVDNGECIVELENIELGCTKSVIHDKNERLDPPSWILSKTDIHLNRIDRVTGSADVYKITCFKPHTKMGIIIQGEEEDVELAKKLLAILSNMGIGGYRSRGYGKFRLSQGKLCDEEILLTSERRSYKGLLGSYVFNQYIVDVRESFINKKVIEGYAGPPYDSYTLPRLEYIGAGSIVKTLGPIEIQEYIVKKSKIGATLVFNPMVL